MTSELPEWVQRVFSTPRFTPYLDVSGRNVMRAWQLYRWNVEVSEAFYGPLHCLEIGLRNAEHDQLRARYGRADWWEVAPLRNHDAFKIAKAREDLGRRSRRSGIPFTADDVLAELSFGFWVSLLSQAYDRHLWVPALHRAFPHYSGRRGELRDNLQAMVLFRNRIMHHEPIHHRHLAADHAKIYRLLGYLEPEVAPWLRRFDRVPEILARRPEEGHGDEQA
ncbi:hypothetical protein AB0F88_05860 [Streptosporangium sp. NPDC023963]|uniref:hypothetical protein n=1 Tax=Streptosporangium sp. NPDC023963 TaxID=3155608 RepID=UPI0034308BB4